MNTPSSVVGLLVILLRFYFSEAVMCTGLGFYNGPISIAIGAQVPWSGSEYGTGPGSPSAIVFYPNGTILIKNPGTYLIHWDIVMEWDTSIVDGQIVDFGVASRDGGLVTTQNSGNRHTILPRKVFNSDIVSGYVVTVPMSGKHQRIFANSNGVVSLNNWSPFPVDLGSHDSVAGFTSAASISVTQVN